MNIWRILGIEPTCDAAVIKSAYAAMAKVHHPEEQPEEFQKLQMAYKSAMQYAKTHAKRNVEEQPEAGKDQPVSGEETAQEEIIDEEPIVFISWEEYLKNESQEEPQSPGSEEENFQEKPFGHERIIERTNETSHRIDAGDILDQSDIYDYEGIGEEYAPIRFWKELAVFIYHPYLRNNADCWRYFLEQPDYKELFRDNDFRKKFVEYISGECPENWHRDTVGFLDKYLKGYGKDALTLHETFLPCWRKLLGHASGEKSLLMRPCDTKEEWEAYRVLWGRDLGQKKGGTLKDGEEIRKYLMSFFVYAAENRDRLEAIYRKSTRVRHNRRLRYRRLTVFCVCAIAVTALIRVIEMSIPSYEREMKDLKEEYNQVYSEIYDDQENKKIDGMVKEAVWEYEQLMTSK